MRSFKFAGVLLVSILASCSTDTSSPTPIRPSTADLVAQISSHCTDLDAPELGRGKRCVDNGFRISTDDFSFANWGRSSQADANVTAQTLIDLFGHESVCMPGIETQCLLRPTTMQKLEEWNNALSGGRCEGFATLSTRFYLKLDHPADFQPGTQRVAQLSQSNPSLQQSLVYWWATQFLNEVTDRAATSRSKSPLQLVDELIQGLANGVGYTLGLYQNSSGHSVTPFAVTMRDKSFVVHVYDNNFPGKRKEILVDSVANTWLYKDAVIGIDGQSAQWSGGTGTFELTPMSARQGPFECSFCNTTKRKTPIRLSLASRDPKAPGFLLITTTDGHTFHTTPQGITNNIPRLRYTVGKGSSGSLISVEMPSAVGEFTVRVQRASSVIPAGDVVVGIQRPGSASIQVSGNLAQSVLGASPQDADVIRVTSRSTTISAPRDAKARVSIAGGSHISRIALDAGDTFVVNKISKDAIEVFLKGSNGANKGSTPLNASSVDTISEVALSAENGTLSQTPVGVEPIYVRPRQQRGFTPSVAKQPTTTVPSSIVIALPD